MPTAWRDTFERMDGLLDEALDLPTISRPGFVQRIAVADAPAGARLSALLAATTPAHTHVGPYRIVRELGRGGMGSVFLAERSDDGLHLTVALKVLPRELGTPRAIERFRQERQILARVNHPNIAKLMDGGVWQGLPWFAMEHVEGIAVDRYCALHKLPIARRLELFRDICVAVQHAHRHLVVHRDLKPSNILVDGEGRVKLLDFGIAQLVRSDARDRTPCRALTPEYASPEQLSGQAVSIATDVFSLGVLLHELLTGQRPDTGVSRSPPDVLRALRARPPALMSAVISGLPLARRERVSRERGVTPRQLLTLVAGDLDAIVLKATRLDAAERYDTVALLAADVAAVGTHQPIRARPHTAAYVARRFVRRHVVVVSALIAILLSLTGIVATSAVQAYRVARERDNARQMADFLASLFRYVNPYSGGSATVSARQLLDSGAARVTRDWAGQPQARAKLMATIAHAYGGLGHYDESRRLLGASLDIQRTINGDASPEVAATLVMMAEMTTGMGRYTEARALYAEALARRRVLLGAAHPGVARTMVALARVERMLGLFSQADTLLHGALAIDRRHLGEDGEDLAATLRGLAHLSRDRGDYNSAASFYREAWQRHRARYGDDHVETANSLINLAVITHLAGDPARAEPMLRRGLEVKRRRAGAQNPDVATDMVHSGEVLRALGREHEARVEYEAAIAMQRQTRPAGHPLLAAALAAYGELLVARGEGARAVPVLREALAIRRAVYPANHWEVAQSESLLGAALQTSGETAEGKLLLDHSVGVLTTVLGGDHPETRRAATRCGAGGR